MFRIKFPKYDTTSGSGFIQTRQIRVSIMGTGPRDVSSVSTTSDGSTLITGIASDTSGGVSGGAVFNHYFAIAVYSGPDGLTPIKSIASGASSSTAFVQFAAEDPNTEEITLRVGTSFISADQALLNLESEVGKKSFDDVLQESHAEWESVLSRVDVTVPSAYTAQERNDLYTVFYSALYRASLFPRDISEVDASGNAVHWSPYSSGGPFAGPMTTDSGFWDAYSTVYPYLSLINRPRLGAMLQGWVNSYQEGGWLPKWASPGYRGSMVGTMGDATLADAIIKQIPGFDVDAAYEAIRKDAFVAPDANSSGVGRPCLPSYLKYGYIPRGSPSVTGGTCSEVLSENLLYLQADYAISEAAKFLGKATDADELQTRSGNYAVIFDGDSTGLFRSRDIVTQKFTEPFDQFAWGGDYTEAGPWQYRFHMPFDPKGLRDLYQSSGLDMCAELTRAQTMAGVYHIGDYGSQIHEQTEFAENCWGQYSHNNQPVHHMLYMFGASDTAGFSGACAAKGQEYLRRAQLELYAPGVDMFAGDDDNGQMGAWFVLSSIGLYSLSPGSEEYVFGSPLFERVSIALDDGKFLDISAENSSKSNVHISRVTWNGVDFPQGSNGIKYSDLMMGGELKFYMN
jgi:predicted alpha-1,2-mannosidase